MNTQRYLFIGDLIGPPGLSMFSKWAPVLREKHSLDAIIVNGENSAKNGRGITPKIINFLKECGANVITTGNHVWEHKDVYNLLNERDDVIRPINYPAGCPGKGYTFLTVKGHSIAIVNLHGRVFVRDMLDCPFRAIESLLMFLRNRTNTIFIDFHAEATSEKRTMGLFLDGKISGIFGTHTHIQTADEQIMPGGTAYLTDLGGTGALNSSIGVEYEAVLARFLYHPKASKFVVATKGPMVMSGIIVDVDIATGKTVKIERIRIIDQDIDTTRADHAL